MKASIHFELETPKDFEAFAAIFSTVAGKTAPADVVHAEAPQPDKAIAAPKADKPAKAKAQSDADRAEADAKAQAQAEKPAGKDEAAVEAETVDKALVAKELRAFIQAKGETGPKQALSVLKDFDANKFDELKAEDYSKFLSALKKAA